MKESVLWRRLDRAVGTRLRARYKNKESGVAMVMALMFILVVLLTSTLLLGILLSQALPYRNNARNAQGKVAAEAGLQAGLSFLRTTESYYETGNYDKLMPATTADPSKTSLDETYAVETATASSSATGTAKVVTLNYVPVNDTTSGTTAVSTSSSTHDQKLSYRIQIGYYDGDPNTTGKLVSDATKLSTVKYAVVVSYGYVNRYPDGRTAGTEADPVRTAAAIYKFGQATEKPNNGNGGHNGAASVSFVQSKQMDKWVRVTGTTFTANGDIDTVTADDNYSDLTKNIPDPRSSLCMVASNGKDGTPLQAADFIDASTGKFSEDIFNSRINNAVVRIFRRATSTDNGPWTFKYSSYCQSHGDYRYTNNWIYYGDDSIRLARWNGTVLVATDWCVTGLSVNDANANANAARLTKCGNSYSPKITGTQIVPGSNHGYSEEAELKDSDSQLMKSQKWAFYYRFINAAYLNKDSTGSYTKVATGGLVSNTTLYQQLMAVQVPQLSNTIGNNDFHRSCDANANGNNTSDSQYDGSKQCYLQVSTWSTGLSASGLSTTDEYFSSLGSAGEAGWETHQIVSDTGYCMNALGASTDNAPVLSFLCSVNAAPLRPFCNKSAIDNQYWNYSVAPQCPLVPGDESWQNIGDNSWQNDYVDYAKGGETVIDTATGLAQSTAPSKTNLTFTANTGVGCFVVTGTSEGSTLVTKFGNCTTSDDRATFYRYEKVADEGTEPEKAKFNYTYVLASSVADEKQPWLSPGVLCLTETTGLTQKRGSLPDGQKNPRIELQKCQGAMYDATGAKYYPQRWNAPDKDSSANKPGIGTSYNVTANASISYASSKYVDAANWKW
ncbi:hypothetical protein ACLUWA_02395 [Bifidobacterium thermophilum]|uniref:hypothetical protein n=1 Tax=Bifidobacterium thermophilum TaxID=33905 RepID=UPI00399675A5